MKFNVGYQLLEDSSLVSKIIEYKDRISEVYFSFGDFPNGRNNQLRNDIFTALEAQEKQIADLTALSREGYGLIFCSTVIAMEKTVCQELFLQK